MSLKIGATEDFWATPVVIKGDFFSKRRINYKVVSKENKKTFIKDITTGRKTIAEVAQELGCNKRNVKNWIKHK